MEYKLIGETSWQTRVFVENIVIGELFGVDRLTKTPSPSREIFALQLHLLQMRPVTTNLRR